MIRATAGTWISYATTLLFQILFAAQFGSSAEASGFILVFALSVSLAAIFITTASVLIVPRIVESDDRLSIKALRMLGLAGLGVTAAAGALVVAAIAAPGPFGDLLGLADSSRRPVLLLSAAIVLLFGLAGIAAAIPLSRGRRFIPSVAPAIPSLVGATYLLMADVANVTTLYAALAIGGGVQLAVIGASAWIPRPNLVGGTHFDPGRQAMATASVLVLLSLLVPVQRFMAGSGDIAGVARFDYAARSLQAAQQLLIGGVLIALLPDWSRITNDPELFRARVSKTVTGVALLLAVAGVVALIAAPQLVAIVFERGVFTAEDTAEVGSLIRMMSVGFVAEGISLVLVQAAYASHRPEVAIRIGFLRFGLQLVLTILLGSVIGAAGVAMGYTITMGIIVVVTFAATRRFLGTATAIAGQTG